MKRTGFSLPVIAGLLAAVCLNAGTVQNHDGSIKWDGYTRTYLIHVSASLDKTKPAPLLIALHGGGGRGKGMWSLTQGGLDRLADEEGFIVVYPDGYKKHWNDGRKDANDAAHNKDIDDVGFISALIDSLIAEHNVDPKRVYVTGISNGGMMSYRLACELSDRIAAIAPVATAMPINMPYYCSPANPVSVIVFSGTSDPLIPFEGGQVQVGSLKRGRVLSVYQSINYWMRQNGCAATPDVAKLPDLAPDDGTRVEVKVYSGGDGGSEVMLYTIKGGGHTWPGGLQYLGERSIGRTCRDIDANQVIWEFFKQHSR